jgi:peptide chain release factor 2
MLENDLEKKLKEIEEQMADSAFWDDKDRAKEVLKQYESLKTQIRDQEQILRGSAIINIFSGAGGDDAEDWTRMLYEMYQKYAAREKFTLDILDKSENTHGGYRSITMQIDGKGVYGKLKNESGVHRLIRQSPFNAKSLRQTSFSYVEVLPVIADNTTAIEIKTNDLDIQTTKSGGPGGQNVNKRETAVRITHIPTKISVHVTSERSQAQNKELALTMLKGKLYNLEVENAKKIHEGLKPEFNKAENIEWGNQIRTYTLHPYKLIKDHRTNVETSDVENVLGKGNLDIFL